MTFAKFLSFRRFSNNIKGNVAIMFSLSGVVLVALAGGAIDFRNTYNAQTRFQAAADSAALATALHYRTSTWRQAKRVGRKQFKDNVVLGDGLNLTRLKFRRQGEAVVVTAKGKRKSYLLSIIGMNKLKFKVKSIVKYPDYPIEVALVLDNTFSMSIEGKIQALKEASNDFVDTLLVNPSDDVKISIVPFAQYVNVGVDKLNETWLDAENEEITIPEQCTTQKDIVSKSGCSNETTYHPATNVPQSCTGAVYNDGVLVRGASCRAAYTRPAYSTTAEQCSSYTYGPEYETCTPESTYTVYWNGCVASRNYPLNLKDTSYSTQVPGPNNLVCGNEITPLTDNKTTLTTAINSMNPVGDTYIPQGIVWGTRTLSSGKPFNQAMSDGERSTKKGKRYLVIMTDGINFRSPDIPSSPLHTGTDVSKSDDYMIEACNDAKAKDIIVFAVTFGTTVNAATKDLMRDCATSSAHYFDAETNDNLQTSFNGIAGAIRTVFLSQ